MNKLLLFIIIICIFKLFRKKEQFSIVESDYSNDLTYEDIENLKKGQEKMTNMLKEMDTICRKHNIQYWMMGGTLLGAVRHKGWIPYDGDIDIGIMDEDFEKFKSVMEDELPSHLWFQHKENDEVFKKNSWWESVCKIRDLNSCYIEATEKHGHNGIQIDVFQFYKINNIVKYKESNYTEYEYKYDDIFPLIELDFEGHKFFAPNNYDSWLTIDYGNYHKLLPLEQRKPHEGLIDPNNTCNHHYDMYPKLYK